MAHFAQLDENLAVIQVIVVSNEALNDLSFPESESVGVDFCRSLFGSSTNWLQTSYNAGFRKNYAGIGYHYDQHMDAFVPPQPFPSWILDTETITWKSPIPYPDDSNKYMWDEPSLSWVLIDLTP